MTRLALLDGPATAAARDQLVAVYRAAMGAAPFHQTEVETGFAYGLPTPEIPAEGWYGSLREAVGPDAAERWLTGQFAVVWIAVHPDRRGRGLGRELLERLLAGAGSERAWLVTHDLDTPARALYRSLGFRHLGRGPLGWHDAERVVLGADLPPTSRSSPAE